MKTKLVLSCALLLLASSGAALAAGPSAFALIREGNRYIGEQSKDRVVAIHSDKSSGQLTPDIWYITYYDPDAPLKAIEVKFGAGQKMDVSRPFRLLEPITGNDRIIDRDRLRVDSDRALEIARSQPLLRNLTLTSSQLWLEHSPEGPRWKVKLWAGKFHDPEREVDVGDVYISTVDGTVMKSDLHPGSAT